VCLKKCKRSQEIDLKALFVFLLGVLLVDTLLWIFLSGQSYFKKSEDSIPPQESQGELLSREKGNKKERLTELFSSDQRKFSVDILLLRKL